MFRLDFAAHDLAFAQSATTNGTFFSGVCDMISPLKKPRVLVAMSGGVDSSVAAALLVD
ncbi:MAG: hypothetical protein ACXWC9_05345, partial [Pseudobdellovibrionaceae bacterium]